MSLDRKPEDYIADYTDFCKDAEIDPNQESSIKSYINEYTRWHVMFKGISDIQTDAFDLEDILKNKEKYTIDESINLKESKLLESHLDDYSSEKEYTVTYLSNDGKDKEVRFKPSKNTNIAGIQKELGKQYKDFFKLKDIKEVKKEIKTESKKFDVKSLNKAWDVVLNKLKEVGNKSGRDDVRLKTDEQGNIHVYNRKNEKEICVVTQDELKKIMEDKKVESERNLTISEKLLQKIIQSVNSKYTLDNVVCETSPEGNVHIMTRDGHDICTVGRETFAIAGDDTILIDELRENGYWKEPDFDTLEEEVLIEKEQLTEATNLSAKDDNNVVVVNKNQYGYNTIAIIIDNTNKRFQLVTGQSLPTGKYKKASKKAIRQKAEDLRAQGYEEVRGNNSLAESKKVMAEDEMEIYRHRKTKLDQLQADIIYNFEEAYKDWGKEVSSTKNGFVNEYMSEFCNDFEEVNWKDYLVAIPEIDELYKEYGNTPDYKIPEDIKIKFYELITDYVQKYLNKVYDKKTESVEDIMAGKELSVKDKEILAYVEDRLVDELGKDWRRKSLIDIEDITYIAVDQYAIEHGEEDLNPSPYYKEIKKLCEGRVTTAKGEFEYEELKAMETEMKNAFKDYWNGKIKSTDLEAKKKELGLSEGEIRSCQYMASREFDAEKVEESKLFESTESNEVDDIVTEYVITYNDINKDDDIFDNKEDADAKFEEIKASGNIDKVYQYFKKDWELTDGEYTEGDVDVYYTDGDILEEELYEKDIPEELYEKDNSDSLGGYLHIEFTDGSNPFLKFTNSREEIDKEIKKWERNYKIEIKRDLGNKVFVTATELNPQEDLFKVDEDLFSAPEEVYQDSKEKGLYSE